MKTRHLFVVSLFALGISGCVFHPDDDDNFQVVNPDVIAPPVVISLTDVSDTINVTGEVNFKFTIEGLDAERFYYVEMFTETHNSISTATNGSFRYNPPPNTSGYEKLTIRAYVKSNSGSLADLLRKENLVYENGWVLRVDTKVPDEFEISDIRPDQGSLRIEWPKYTRINFKAYGISKSIGSTSKYYRIPDVETNFFYDSTFVGGEATYALTIETVDGSTSQTIRRYEDIVPTPLTFEVGPLPEASLRVHFSPSRYPANVGSYEIYESMAPNNLTDLLFTTSDPLENSFNFSPVFGHPRYLTIKTTSRKITAENYRVAISASTEYVYGEKAKAFDQILFAPQIDRLYVINGNKLDAFTYATNEYRGTLTLPAAPVVTQISPLQDKIVALSNSRLYFWDGLTLNQTAQYTLGSGQDMVGFGLTQDNRLLLSKRTNAAGAASLIVYDLNTQTVISEYPGFRLSTHVELSDDGKFVRNFGGAYSRIASIEDTEINPFGLVALNGEPLLFNPENQSQAITGIMTPHPDGNIVVSDIVTANLVERVSTPPMSVYFIEPHRGLVAGYESNGARYMLFDFVNQETKWIGRVMNVPVVHGDYLYSTEGVRLKILE